jgi:hypothetical protein
MQLEATGTRELKSKPNNVKWYILQSFEMVDNG